MKTELLPLALTLTATLLLYMRHRYGDVVGFKEYAAFICTFVFCASLWIAIAVGYWLSC